MEVAKIFFSKLTFRMNKTLLSALMHGVSRCIYHMLMRQNIDPIWSKLLEANNPHKRPPRLDILDDRLLRVDCISAFFFFFSH